MGECMLNAKSPQIHFADFPTLTQTLQNYTIIELNYKPSQVLNLNKYTPHIFTLQR